MHDQSKVIANAVALVRYTVLNKSNYYYHQQAVSPPSPVHSYSSILAVDLAKALPPKYSAMNASVMSIPAKSPDPDGLSFHYQRRYLSRQRLGIFHEATIGPTSGFSATLPEDDQKRLDQSDRIGSSAAAIK
jgi:hypothetical protein